VTSEIPFPAFHFQVDLGGTSGAFAEVEGLATSRRAIAYRNGDEPRERFLTFSSTSGRVTLRRGIVGSSELHGWYRARERRDVVVSLLDEQGQSVQRWRLLQCVPVSLIGPTLGSLLNEVAIEELVLQPEAIEVE
jgi:phage tail-like protein